jgi:hypothetical protein
LLAAFVEVAGFGPTSAPRSAAAANSVVGSWEDGLKHVVGHARLILGIITFQTREILAARWFTGVVGKTRLFTAGEPIPYFPIPVTGVVGSDC